MGIKTHKLSIGSYGTDSSGRPWDRCHNVEFQAEYLGVHEDTDHRNSRGMDQKLYRLEDGRLVVHIRNWSIWQGETTSLSLQEIIEKDLMPTGKFKWLGQKCGFSGPLTVDEALEFQEEEESWEGEL